MVYINHHFRIDTVWRMVYRREKVRNGIPIRRLFQERKRRWWQGKKRWGGTEEKNVNSCQGLLID